jgi:hypothetical protein
MTVQDMQSAQVRLARGGYRKDCAWNRRKLPRLGSPQWLPGDPRPWHVVAVSFYVRSPRA